MYPIENWNEEDARNLRDSLASDTWQKVLALLKSDQAIVAETIFTAHCGNMSAVAEMSKAQGTHETLRTLFDYFDTLSKPKPTED